MWRKIKFKPKVLILSKSHHNYHSSSEQRVPEKLLMKGNELKTQQEILIQFHR